MRLQGHAGEKARPKKIKKRRNRACAENLSVEAKRGKSAGCHPLSCMGLNGNSNQAFARKKRKKRKKVRHGNIDPQDWSGRNPRKKKEKKKKENNGRLRTRFKLRRGRVVKKQGV